MALRAIIMMTTVARCCTCNGVSGSVCIIYVWKGKALHFLFAKEIRELSKRVKYKAGSGFKVRHLETCQLSALAIGAENITISSLNVSDVPHRSSLGNRWRVGEGDIDTVIYLEDVQAVVYELVKRAYDSVLVSRLKRYLVSVLEFCRSSTKQVL